MTHHIEFKLQIALTPAGQEAADACFLDVEMPAPSRVLGTYTCRPDQDMSGLETVMLFEILRHLALNDNDG